MKIFWFTIIFVVGSPALAQLPEGCKTRECVGQAGETAFKAGEFEKARELFSAAIKAGDKHPTLFYNKARATDELRDRNEATDLESYQAWQAYLATGDKSHARMASRKVQVLRTRLPGKIIIDLTGAPVGTTFTIDHATVEELRDGEMLGPDGRTVTLTDSSHVRVRFIENDRITRERGVTPGYPDPIKVSYQETPVSLIPQDDVTAVSQTASWPRRETAIGLMIAGGVFLGGVGVTEALRSSAVDEQKTCRTRACSSEYDDYTQSMRGTSFVLGGVGLAAIGAGAYLLITDSNDGAAFVPTTNGAAFVGSF